MSISSLLGSLVKRILPKVEADVAAATEEAVLRGVAKGMNSAAAKVGLVDYDVASDLQGVPALVLGRNEPILVASEPTGKQPPARRRVGGRKG